MLISINKRLKQQVSSMSAATGIVLFDMLIRPFFKVAMKFPLVGFLILFAIYGVIAYVALKSAYLAENH